MSAAADPRTSFFSSGGIGQSSSDSDARTDFFNSGTEDKPVTPWYEHLENFGKIALQHPMAAVAGAGEAGLSAVSSGAGSLADALTFADPGTHDWSYKPRTAAGQELSKLGAAESGAIGSVYDKVAGTGPLAQTVKERVPEFLGAAGTVAGAGDLAGIAIPKAFNPDVIAPKQALSGQEALQRQAQNSPQSMGAAVAVPDISKLSPPLRAAASEAATNGNVNMTALVNHADADRFGIPLMEGQATRDEGQFSNEQNSTNPAITSRIKKQDGLLVNALDDIRGEASPTSVQNSARENGQIALDDLKTYDEPKVAAIDQAYDTYRQSAGGNPHLDTTTFPQDIAAVLKPGNQTKFLPSTVASIVKDISDPSSNLSLNDFEAYTKQLSGEQAKAHAAQDGNAEHAIGLVRKQVESLEPTSDQSAQSLALYRGARALAANRFDEMDQDPAYAAAVNDVNNGVAKGKPSPLADTFLDDYALSKTAPKVQVDAMMSKLGPDGQQAVASHALSAIKNATVRPNGNLAPAGFNGAMQKYGDKLPSLVTPDTQDALEAYGRTLANVKVAPAGNFVNYSKSGVISNAARGVGSELGAAAINAKTFGMGVPIIKGLAEKAWTDRTLKPGAGLDRPSPP